MNYTTNSLRSINKMMEEEKKKICKWLDDIFGFAIEPEIIFESYKKIGAHACSLENKVYICVEILRYKNSVLNFYLPHELIHQYLGVHVIFSGDCSLFILEILVELIQYFYLREKNIDKFYQEYLKKYILENKEKFVNDLNKSLYHSINMCINYIDPFFFKIGVYILIEEIKDFNLLKILLNKIITHNIYSSTDFFNDVAIIWGIDIKKSLVEYLKMPLKKLLSEIGGILC